jgi:hypothetical protein
MEYLLAFCVCNWSDECKSHWSPVIPNKQKTPWPLVRERTIPTERPSLVSEVCRYRCRGGSATVPHGRILGFLDRQLYQHLIYIYILRFQCQLVNKCPALNAALKIVTFLTEARYGSILFTRWLLEYCQESFAVGKSKHGNENVSLRYDYVPIASARSPFSWGAWTLSSRVKRPERETGCVSTLKWAKFTSSLPTKLPP